MSLILRTLLVSLVLSVGAAWGGVNVLIIGSSQRFDEMENMEKAEGALNPSALATNLQRILNQGTSPAEGSSVVYENIYRTKTVPVALGAKSQMIPTEFHCHSLAQYYFWPEERKARLASLSNKGETTWDYVVIIGDPYITAEMPGMYAEGLALVVAKVREGGAKIVVVSPWGSGDEETERIGKVVRQACMGLDVPVAHAGATRSEIDADSGRNGDFLAAASVFSTFSGRVAWGATPEEKGLATQALATIEAMKSQTGNDTEPGHLTPFSTEHVTQNTIRFNQTGTSSEQGIKVALREAMKHSGVMLVEAKAEEKDIDFNYGRGNSNFEPNKRYKVDPGKFGRSYGFAMQDSSESAAESMLYGIDKRYFNSNAYDDGTDLGIAYDMIWDGEVKSGARLLPIRLLWAKLHDANPTLPPLSDNWHMAKALDAASGAFISTHLTGRNPVGEEPSKENPTQWELWQGRKIDYETAIRMSELQFRAAK